MTIGEKIYNLRKEKNFSQEEFAEKLGVSRQSVSKWESDSVLPDSDKIIAMSGLFNVTTDYLLKDKEEINDGNDNIEVASLVDEPEEDLSQMITQANEQANEDVAFADADSVNDNADETTPDVIESPKKNKSKSKIAKIIAVVLATCVLLSAVALPIYFGGIKEAYWAICGGKVQYTYVFVHGLGGWGESSGMDKVSNYWGATAGDLSAHLREEGYLVCEPTVGPVSSDWDRTCELYAQLTGTRVDYGEAHSKSHNHERYGRTYDTPLVENWGKKINGGQRVKVNLIGHSFGGITVRTLAYLLANGDKTEKEATGDDISPLFTGGKGDWVNSVTSLCAPHNGSTLTCVLDSVGNLTGMDNTTDMLASLCFGIAGISKPISGVYDFSLDQFGIGQINGGYDEIKSAIAKVTESGNDHAGYDLSPDGAAEINNRVKMIDNAYYFSYAYCTTKESSLLGIQVPLASTLPVLYPTSLAMGAYTGTTAGGITIDESWRPNDGLVSVVSATCPTGEECVKYTGEENNKLQKGLWNFMGVKDGDHGTVIGLNADTATTFQFYDDLFVMIEALKR